MKKIIILMILISTHLFSNYAFDNDNTVKIDMHGGKNEKLTDNTKGFSEMKMNNFKGLKGISIKNTKQNNDSEEKKVLKIENGKKEI